MLPYCPFGLAIPFYKFNENSLPIIGRGFCPGLIVLLNSIHHQLSLIYLGTDAANVVQTGIEFYNQSIKPIQYSILNFNPDQTSDNWIDQIDSVCEFENLKTFETIKQNLDVSYKVESNQTIAKPCLTCQCLKNSNKIGYFIRVVIEFVDGLNLKSYCSLGITVKTCKFLKIEPNFMNLLESNQNCLIMNKSLVCTFECQIDPSWIPLDLQIKFVLYYSDLNVNIENPIKFIQSGIQLPLDVLGTNLIQNQFVEQSQILDDSLYSLIFQMNEHSFINVSNLGKYVPQLWPSNYAGSIVVLSYLIHSNQWDQFKLFIVRNSKKNQLQLLSNSISFLWLGIGEFLRSTNQYILTKNLSSNMYPFVRLKQISSNLSQIHSNQLNPIQCDQLGTVNSFNQLYYFFSTFLKLINSYNQLHSDSISFAKQIKNWCTTLRFSQKRLLNSIQDLVTSSSPSNFNSLNNFDQLIKSNLAYLEFKCQKLTNQQNQKYQIGSELIALVHLICFISLVFGNSKRKISSNFGIQFELHSCLLTQLDADLVCDDYSNSNFNLIDSIQSYFHQLLIKIGQNQSKDNDDRNCQQWPNSDLSSNLDDLNWMFQQICYSLLTDHNLGNSIALF